MKIELELEIIPANKIAHEVLQHLSAYALELLIEHATKELQDRNKDKND
jgi:hypothetical protein